MRDLKHTWSILTQIIFMIYFIKKNQALIINYQ